MLTTDRSRIFFLVVLLLPLSCGKETENPDLAGTPEEEVRTEEEGSETAPGDLYGPRPREGHERAREVEDAEGLPQLIFYSLPGCPICERVENRIDRMRPHYIDQAHLDYVRDADRRRAVNEEYGFSVGMVLKNAEGEVVWTEAGRQFPREKIENRLADVLADE